MKTMLRLLLRSVGNPDFDEDPDRPVSPAEAIEVDTLEAASAAVLDYVDRHRLGGGNLPTPSVFAGDREVARVSYNGRIWLPPEAGWNDRDPNDWMRWRPVGGGRA